MTVIIVTGSAGLVGSETALYFADRGLDVVGIDNDMRRRFFGDEASTSWQRQRLERQLGARYRHLDLDIRDVDAIDRVFERHGAAIGLVVHAAAQPSHDWAAREPRTDFEINANGTLSLLEATRRHAPDAAFVFCSTNKVYGDAPNRLPLVELEHRWEIDPGHRYCNGIAEDMSVDQCLHSLFGVSKLAADSLVQEYGRYFGLRTACFRGGCLTGPNHSGTQLHGFLAYLMRCAATSTPYTVFGYEAKQVRDNIHSADLVRAFHAFYEAPRVGEVYNIGGGRASNCSMREAIAMCEEITGRAVRWSYDERARQGDHQWYISDLSKLQAHYPGWSVTYDVRTILQEIYDANRSRWARPLHASPSETRSVGSC